MSTRSAPGSPDNARLYALIQALLDQPESGRRDWLEAALPDEPELQARLMAAVGSDDSTVVANSVSFEFESVAPQSELPRWVGRYEVRNRLGHGGMGVVYLAVDPRLNRPVAVKLLLRVDNPEMRERFLREAYAVARLDHRNIVKIFDIGDHEGQPFFAMEYIEGETLAEVIQRRKPLPVARKVRLIAEVCEGLALAHKAGVIHRDIKPANVMVTPSGSTKIIDFGIARIVDSDMTQTGCVPGTPNYLSPEQVEERTANELSDMFAVGLVLYELLTSRKAFPGEVRYAVLTSILSAEPQPLRDLIPDIDSALVEIVNKALRKRPQDRYPSLDAMHADLMRVVDRLESAEGRETVVETGPSIPSDGANNGRSSRWLAPGLAGVVVVGIVIAAIAPAASWRRGAASAPTASSAPSTDLGPDIAPPVVGPTISTPRPASEPIVPAAPPTSPPPRTPSASSETLSSVADRAALLIKGAEELRRSRDYDAAIAKYSEALRLTPRNDKARGGLTEAQAAKQRAEDAINKLEGLGTTPPLGESSTETDEKRLIEAARRSMEANDLVTAQTALEEALRVNPLSEPAAKLLNLLTGP